MKNKLPHWAVTWLLFLLPAFILPMLLPAQGVQWTSSVNVGGSNGQPWADWIFDVITTSEGNYMAVGFAREDEINGAHPDVPAYCLIGPNGHLLRDGVVELLDNNTPPKIKAGRLANVVEGSNDSYYAVGFIGGFSNPKGLLVRINKVNLDAQAFEIVPTGFATARLTEIVNVSDQNYLLISGWASNPGSQRERWVATYNYDGTKKHEIVIPHTGTFGEEANTVLYETLANGNIEIFSAASDAVAVSSPSSGPPLSRVNTDILMSKITYNPTTGTFTETLPASFNSITQRPYSSPGMNGALTVSATDIFATYPPNFSNGQFDKYPYGPRYIGASFQRTNLANCDEQTPLTDLLYVEDWSDCSADFPYSMVSTNNEIVVSALLNRMVMWEGTNDYLGKDAAPGLTCDAGSCSNFDSDYYLWGESYLLFFNKTNLTLNKATYLGTMSGGDFIPKVIKTSDGGFAVSGTVTGCPDGLPTVDGAEHMMVVKVNADGSIAWRKHFNGPGEGACGFAITEAPDGGLVVAGNTEGDGQEHEENYGFIKFSSGLCDYDGAEVLPNSGNDYIIAQNEPEWNTDRTVKARVIVPAGRVLNIKGTAAHPITIRFADSKEVFDFNNRSPLGITVQPGGRVYVYYATLTGFDCNGVQKMWDGINVEGQPGLTQTLANQGFATFSQANIVNARQGTVASAVWAGQTAPTINTYAGTGSQSSSVNSILHHGGPYGGGRILGVNSRWIDNKRSLIFMQYPHNWNNSRFWNCNFISNGPLADPNEMLPPIANNYNYNEPRGTSIHCSIWSTRVRFDNCTFAGSTSIIPDYRPFGVEGDDPKITIVGGNMNDLKIGAECRGPLGGILANLNASGVTFNNVIQSINLRNSVADIVSGCTFTSIPAPNTFAGLTPTGIFGQYNKGGLFQNNEFYGADPDNKSFGLVEHNTSNQGCEIRENKFFDARYGNQFEGDNSELTTNCNDYTDMGFSAWSAVKTGGFGALQDQGSSDPNESKADNEFFDFCDGAWERHIFSEFAFNYYDKTGNPHPADEDCVSDIVNLVIDPTLTPPSCFVPDPCNPPTPDCRLAQFMASTKTIRDRNVALRGMIHTGTAPDTTDLPAAYEYALTVLRTRDQPEDHSILVGSLASMGLYSEAQTENNLLPTGTGEYGAYRAYLNNILGTSTDLYALPQTNYNTALASLEAENVSTRAMAENLHYMREGVYHPLIAIDPESTERSYHSQSAGDVLPAQPALAYPNPFKNEIVFDLRGLDAHLQYQIVLSDLHGSIVMTQQAQGGRILTWNGAQLADGQYTYQIFSEKEVVQNGKLLKISK